MEDDSIGTWENIHTTLIRGWGNMAKAPTVDGRGSAKMLTKMLYPSLDLVGTLTFCWGLRDAFIRPKKPCHKTMGTS